LATGEASGEMTTEQTSQAPSKATWAWEMGKVQALEQWGKQLLGLSWRGCRRCQRDRETANEEIPPDFTAVSMVTGAAKSAWTSR